jgi:DNA-binding winged helix-turn-helix (wHTH) protein/tetratricopeptide (TPR) repeat protein
VHSREHLIYRFGGFELDPFERRLLRAGEPISLTPKIFDTLVALVVQAGHVVSKDELLKLLWPRGYVDESNLTKHVWVIRRALGEGEEGSHFIETVPKLGYRFVAPVTVHRLPAPAAVPNASDEVAPIPPAPPSLVPSPPELSSPPETASAKDAGPVGRVKRRPSTLVLLLSGVGLAVVVVIGWRLTQKPAESPGSVRHSRTVALVGFSNLSHNAKDAWLAPALLEMLGVELNVADNLQVIPDELVRDASTDLAPPAAGGYAPDTLRRLRQRLDADYVVSGSYMVTGPSDDAPLRLDVALQDTRSGALLASVTNQSPTPGLILLVENTGARLRTTLGARSADSQTLSLMSNAQPPNVDVARRLGYALDALRHFDAARARDELLEAVADAPGYAPVYAYLAQAWSALGYRDKSLAAAEQALQHAANLPPEQRLQIEAIADTAHAEPGKAAEAWQALAQMKPSNVEYRLQAIDAQIAAGAISDARATLDELERLPEAGMDPRLELAAARVAASLDDPKGSEAHAENALRQAQMNDSAGLIAVAQLTLGGARNHLNKNEQARTGFMAAIAAYRSVRNPRGEAAARTDLAQALSSLNRNQEAREEYQRAMALDQSIGDLAGVAGVYRNECSLLWVAGDRDGAQDAAQHALQLARETADLSMQAWTLQALATLASDDAASDTALNEFREAAGVDRRAGHQTAWPLSNIADLQRMRGELDAARDTCAQAQTEAAPLTDPQFAIFSGFTCALIEMDRGEEDSARTGFQEVIRRVGTGGDNTYLDNSLMMLAQLDMDHGRWIEARARLEQARGGFAAAEERTGEANAQAILALCAQALGDAAARDQAEDRARKLRQSITLRQEIYVVDIALARLDGEIQADPTAVARLLALAADAEKRRWVGWALEARLAAWEILQERDAGAAHRLRDDIERAARRHGFGRIASLLQRADPIPPKSNR